MCRSFEEIIDSHNLMVNSLPNLEDEIIKASNFAINSLKAGGKILFCGNGGSAADAQHLAAEFVGRFVNDRPPIPAIALTTDSSILTSIANDYSFGQVFSRQVDVLCNADDLLIGISTSGNSKNVVQAVESAKKNGARTIALLGNDGGELYKLVDLPICIPHRETARIQEGHMIIGHYLCEVIENKWCS